MRDIGKKIKFAREYRNLTRTELANGIDSTYRNILRWENGERVPRYETLYNISNVLNIPIDYFSMDKSVEDLESMVTLLDEVGGKLVNKTPTDYKKRKKLIELVNDGMNHLSVKEIEKLLAFEMELLKK